MTEEEARKWPELMQIVEQKVKPDRLNQGSTVNPARWWMFARPAAELTEATAKMVKVLVCSLVSQHLAFAHLPRRIVFSHKLAAFPFEKLSAFSILQSRIHEVWTRFFSSTLEDRLNYSPTDCFETFPFPGNFETDAKLEAVGKEYYEFRAGLMVKNNEGLTKTYNRFHDPIETSLEIKKLRELHAAMDRAVLDAYGWTDLKPTCEFLLDYEEEDEDDGEAGASAPAARRRKKPWRYRWPDEFRDEVLARLLELNKQRAGQERLAGANAEASGKKKGAKKKPKTSGDNPRQQLLL